MSFLFATVLVLLLVAPGLTFFRAYYTDVFSIRYSRLTITDQIFRSIVPGITVQAIAIGLVDEYSNYYVCLDIIGVLLLGAKNDATIQDAFNTIKYSLWLVLIYHFALLFLGLLTGWGARALVRRMAYDRKYRWLRFDNKWHYLLSGEVVEFAEYQEKQSFESLTKVSQIELVFIDVLTKIEDGNVVYSGVLLDYELDEDGGLKSIQLKGTQRKLLSTNPSSKVAKVDESTKDSTQETTKITETITVLSSNNEYYSVLGDTMLIPYDQMLNINITYYPKQQLPLQ